MLLARKKAILNNLSIFTAEGQNLPGRHQHFGLGKENSVDLIVKWTNGTMHEFNNLKANRSYTIDYKKGILED